MRRLALVLLALAAPLAFGADAPPRFVALARVLEVHGDAEAVIARGSAEGVLAASTFNFYPVRPAAEGKDPEPQFDVIIARGNVATLRDHTTVCALTGNSGELKAGDAVSYVIDVPLAWKDDPLFEAAANDTVLTALEDKPLVTFADLLADREAKGRTALIEKLRAEIAAHVKEAATTFPNRITGGRYHGQLMADVFRATTVREVEDFLDVVRTYGTTYGVRTLRLVETYATWIANGAPLPERERAERKAAPSQRAGDLAAAKGDFPAAEEAYRTALTILPEDETLRGKLERIVSIRLRKERLARDPDDTSTRWEQVLALYRCEAFDLANAELAVLEKAGYDENSCLRYRGYIAVRQGRFDQAIEYFRRLAQRVKDAELDGWIRFAEAKARLAKEPKSFEAHLQVARVHEEDRKWDDALSAYREAASAATTPEQLKLATAAQERVAALKEVARLVEVAQGEIERHEFVRIPDQMKAVNQLCKSTGDLAACILPRMSELAESARSVYEMDVAIVLLDARTKVDEKDAGVWRDLAFVQLQSGRLDEAAAAVAKALELEPKSAYGLAIRGRVRLLKGDLAGAAQDTAAAVALDAAYAWPFEVGAHVAAARGDWDTAAKLAARALDIDPSDERQRTFGAVQLGRAAAADVAAGKEAARNRLRLVRAFVRMELFEQASREATQLKGTPFAADAQWEMAAVETRFRGLDAQLASLQLAGVNTPLRKVRQEVLLAQKDVLANPESPATHLRLAKAWNAAGSYHRALVAISSLSAAPTDPGLQDAGNAARRALEAYADYEAAGEAFRREDYATAEARLARTAEVYAQLGAKSDLISTLYLRALALGNLAGRHAEALALYDTVRTMAREYGDLLNYHAATTARARLNSQQGSIDELVAAQTAGIEYARSVDDTADEALSLITLAYISMDAGRQREGIDLATQALARSALIGGKYVERSALFALGDLQFSNGNTKEARHTAEELLSKSRLAKDPYNERQALVLLGALDMAAGDAVSALARFDEMYELGRRAGNTSDRALARLFQGRTRLYVSNEPKPAIERFQQSAELYASLGDSWNEARGLAGVGEARVLLGDSKGAVEVLTLVRDRYRSMKRRTDQASSEVELAHAFRIGGRLDDAIATARSAVGVADRTEMLDLRYQAHYALGRALEDQGKLEDAAASYERAVLLLAEEMARSSNDADQERWLGVGRRRQVFRDAVDLLIRLGRTDRAMELAQLSRDAQVRSKLGPRGVQAQRPELQRTLEVVGDAEDKAKAAKKALNQELAKPEGERNEAKVQALSEIAAKSEGELRQLLLRLRRDHRRLYSMLAFSPENVGDLRDALPPDALVVQYFVTEDATFIFTLRKDRARTRAVKVPVKSSELGDTVFEFVSALKAELPDAPELGAKLYGWLLAPVEDELAAAHTTLLVPFGALHYLPFHALGTKDASGDVHYAIERFRLGYLSSTTLLKLQKAQRSSAEGALLAFANPDGSLPGARAEMEHVVQQGYRGAKVLYEAEAKKARFFELAGGYRILHFATHGIVTTDPAASFLKLADSELTVNEIMGFEGLEGKTDLVVLSACQTAMEKGQATEDEPISIASAFATSGAPTLVASLWSVNDEATSELMSRFYANLQKRGNDLDTLESLRKAQLGVMTYELNGGRPFAAPKYWAAFELVGDYR